MIVDISSIIPAITFVPYITFMVFGLYHKKSEKPLVAFMLYMLLQAVWSFGSMMMHANTGIMTPLFWNRFMLIGLLGVPITMYHSLLHLIGTTRRSHGYVLVVGYLLYFFLQYLNFSGSIVTAAGFEGRVFTYTLGKGALLAYPLCYSMLLFGILHLVKELIFSKNDSLKQKLRLPLFGTIIMITGILMNLYEPIGRYPVDLFASSIHAFTVFYAVYRFRLIHYSSLAIQVILYFLLISISILGFIGVIRLTFLSVGDIPIGYSIIPSLFLGVIVAVIFQPFRLGTQLILERLYYGKRLSYYSHVRTFLESISSIVEPNELGTSMIDMLIDSFETAWACMFLTDYSTKSLMLIARRNIPNDEGQQAAVIPFRTHEALRRMIRESGEVVYIPHDGELIEFETGENRLVLRPGLILLLRFKKRLNGIIVLGRRTDRNVYDRFDTEILDLLARQCAVTLENAISFERLKRQQRKLQTQNDEVILSRNKLQAFFDGITTPITIQDINYNVVAANIAATHHFKRSFQDLIGKKCYQVFFNRSKPCEVCMAQDCYHAQIPFNAEMADPGSGMVFDLNFYPVAVPIGQHPLFIEFFRDVTQQKKLQEDLEQAERLAIIGTLTAGISNGLKGPLQDIVEVTTKLASGSAAASEIPELSAHILNRARSATEVLQDLAQYSDRGGEPTERADLTEILESSLKLVGRGMDLTDIAVTKDFPDISAEIEVNPNELQQVVMNIIINTVRGIAAGGELVLTCRRQDWFVTFSVLGRRTTPEPGDPSEGSPSTANLAGAGVKFEIGTCRQIVHKMGGRIDAEIRPDSISEIVLSLPVTVEDSKRIRYVHAKTRQEIEDVFFLQRKVLVGEKGYIEETIRKDPYLDAYLILAYKGLHPVGTVTCTTTEPDQGQLMIEQFFDLGAYRAGKASAEIARLAVLKEERASLIPLGLMVMAYIYIRNLRAESVFIDVFSDETKLVRMYRKLGFSKIGEYSSPLPVTVMYVDQQTDYEREDERMNQFVRPFMHRLEPKLDLPEDEKRAYSDTIRRITRKSRRGETKRAAVG